MDDEEKKALQDLLKLLSDHPELADRITITIRPAKIKQGTDKRKCVGRGGGKPPPPLSKESIADNDKESKEKRNGDHLQNQPRLHHQEPH